VRRGSLAFCPSFKERFLSPLTLRFAPFAPLYQASTLLPKWEKGWSRKALALFYLRRYPEAMAAYDVAIRLAPGKESLRTARAESKAALLEATMVAQHHPRRPPSTCVYLTRVPSGLSPRHTGCTPEVAPGLVWVNRTQVWVNRTQVCVNRTQVWVNLTQVWVKRRGSCETAS
jgi:hypothetical protein